MKKLIIQEDGNTLAEFPLTESWQKKLVRDFISSYYEHVLEGGSASSRVRSVSSSDTSPSDTEVTPEFVVMASDQRDKKEVIRWNGTRVTGNVVATLQSINALEASGSEYQTLRDLLPLIRRNARYGLDVNGTKSIRSQIRWLKSKGLMTGNRLTSLGKRMAEAVPVIEKPEDLDEPFPLEEDLPFQAGTSAFRE